MSPSTHSPLNHLVPCLPNFLCPSAGHTCLPGGLIPPRVPACPEASAPGRVCSLPLKSLVLPHPGTPFSLTDLRRQPGPQGPGPEQPGSGQPWDASCMWYDKLAVRAQTAPLSPPGLHGGLWERGLWSCPELLCALGQSPLPIVQTWELVMDASWCIPVTARHP